MSRHGYTLVELAVIMVVMGITLAAATPAFVSYSRSLSLDQARETLIQDLRRGRQTAVTAHHPVIIAFTAGVGGASYSVHGDRNGDRARQAAELWRSQSLPPGVSLKATTLSPSDSILFDPTGALASGASGGQLFLENNGRRDTLIVSPTGIVYRP